MDEYKIIRLVLFIAYIGGSGYLAGRAARLKLQPGKAFLIGFAWGALYGIALSITGYFAESLEIIARKNYDPVVGVAIIVGVALVSGAWSAMDAYKVTKET